MKISFHTNLDLAQRFVFNMKSDRVPSVGERYSFRLEGTNKRFDLEVTGVTNHVSVESNVDFVSVELHIPKYWTGSIQDWEIWFKKHTGVMY